MSTIKNYGENTFPEEVLTGNRALTVQSYEEVNSKKGTQWEASRRIVGTTEGSKSYSLIKTGAMPLDLKRRELGYTGKGLIARIYKNPSAVTLPTPDNVFNMRASGGGFRDFEIYTLVTAPASLGTKIGADMVLEGEQSKQGKGEGLHAVGPTRVLDSPDTFYLLEIESLDAQNISARLEMYNGYLDLPR